MNPDLECAPRRPRRLWACCLCSALTVVAALAVFHPLLTPPLWPKLLLTGDYHWYHGPQAFNLDAALHDGEFPLWNPLTLCGQPFAANPQISVFYPPNLVRSLLNFHPTPEKTHLGLMALVLLHLIIAALGTYALSRDYGLSRGASAVAVLAYVFGPTFVRRVLLQWVLVASAAWLPWQILLLRRAIRAESLRGRLFYGLAGAGVFAMNILAGFPQLTFCTAILMGLFFLFEQFVHLRWADLRAPAAALRRFAGSSASSALLFLVAALLAAAVLVPGAEYGAYGGRARGQGFEVQAAGQDLSPGHILRSLIVYPGDTDAEQGARGAGLIVLLLAVAAFTHTRRREVLLFALLFYLMTECTLGPPFPFGWLVSRMDVLQFSSPWRAGILTGFPLAMLAAFGTDAVTERFRTWPRGIARALLLVVAGGVPAWFLLWWLNAAPYVQPGSAAVYIPLAGLAVAVLAGFIRLPRLWRTLLIGLLFAEILVWNSVFIPRFLATQSYRGDTAFLHEHPSFWQDNYRGGDPEPNMDLYRLKSAMNGYDPMRIERVRQLVCDPKKTGYYYRFVKDWETTSENQRGNLLLKRGFWLARQYARGPLPGKEEVFPPTTTVFFPEAVPKTTLPEVPRDAVIGRGVSDDTRKVPLLNAQELGALVRPAGPGRMIVTLPAFKLDHAHDLLYIRYRSRQIASDVAVSFTEPGTGRAQRGKHLRMQATGDGSAMLEIPLPAFESVQASLTCTASATGPAPQLEAAWLLLDRADEDSLIRVLERKRNSVDVELNDLPGERILLFLDSWYPGWSATVDGAPAPIFLADDAFKAIVVPTGTHRVRFAFSSPAVYLGVALSLVTLLLTVLALYALRSAARGACTTVEQP